MLSIQALAGLKRPHSPTSQASPLPDTAVVSSGVRSYRSIDPGLSIDQERDYEQAEAIWRDVIQKATGEGPFQVKSGLIKQPTFQQFEALRHCLDQRSDVGLKILPSHKKNGRFQEGFTKFSPKENRPVISFYMPNPRDPEDIANSFQTLSHEFMHAPHFNRPSIQPRERKANFDLCTCRMENLIEENCKRDVDWKTLFMQDSTVRYEVGRLPVKSLNALKVKLMTEAIAYELARNDSNRFDKGMASGYRAAIGVINYRLQQKQNWGAAGLMPNKRQRLHSYAPDTLKRPPAFMASDFTGKVKNCEGAQGSKARTIEFCGDNALKAEVTETDFNNLGIARREQIKSGLLRGLKLTKVNDSYAAQSNRSQLQFIPKEELEDYQVDMRDGELYFVKTHEKLPEKTMSMIFVLDKDLRLFVNSPQIQQQKALDKRHAVQHFLMLGKDSEVAGAGNILCAGNKYLVNNQSGGYTPHAGIARQTERVFRDYYGFPQNTRFVMTPETAPDPSASSR